MTYNCYLSDPVWSQLFHSSKRSCSIFGSWITLLELDLMQLSRRQRARKGIWSGKHSCKRNRRTILRVFFFPPFSELSPSSRAAPRITFHCVLAIAIFTDFSEGLPLSEASVSIFNSRRWRRRYSLSRPSNSSLFRGEVSWHSKLSFEDETEGTECC